MRPNHGSGTRVGAGVLRWCLVAALVAAPIARADVPGQISYQGRLTKADGSTESRTVGMKFRLFESSEGGDAVWTEAHDRVPLSDGNYVVHLGELTPLTGVEFDGRERWLEIEVENSVLSPRQKLVSAPYAIRAREATNVKGGSVDATSVAVGGNVVIDGQGRLAGNARYVAGTGINIDAATRAISLDTGCDTGQVLKWTGTAWACAVDGGASYGAGEGLQLSNGQFSLKTSCQAGQILKWNGGSWACSADANDTVVAGSGLAKTGSTLSLVGTCNPGQVLKWNGADWLCAADGGNTYAAGTGLRLDGAAFSLMACNAGETVKSDGATWSCGADNVGNYRVAAGSGLELSGANAFSLRRDCQPGEVLAWSGTAWTCAPDADTPTSAGAGLVRTGNSLAIVGCPAGQVLKSDGTSWACAVDANTPAATAGLGLERVGNALQLKSTCADGQVLKWDGSDWGCAADANNTYRAQTGGGLAVATGNQISLVRSCATDEVLHWDGTAWVCSADQDTTYTAGTGLALAGRVFSLTKSCAANEILKWDGSAWACAADSAGTYVAGAGLSLNGSAFSLLSTCSSGQILKWNGTWVCAADADTTYSAGDGLALSGTTFTLKTGCSAGQVLKWNGGQWACAADLDTSTSYTAGSGLQLTGTSFSLNLGCAADQVLKFTGTAWACAADANDAALTAGDGIKIASGSVSVDSTGCTAGQVHTWNGTNWTCAAPVNDTRYYTKTEVDAVANTQFKPFTGVLAVRDASYCPTGWKVHRITDVLDQDSSVYIEIYKNNFQIGGGQRGTSGNYLYARLLTTNGITHLCSKTFKSRSRPFVHTIFMDKATPAAASCPTGYTWLPHSVTRENGDYTYYMSNENGFWIGGINNWDWSYTDIDSGYAIRHNHSGTSTQTCFKVYGVEEDAATKYGAYPVYLGVRNSSGAAACPSGWNFLSKSDVDRDNNWTYFQAHNNGWVWGYETYWTYGGDQYSWRYWNDGYDTAFCWKVFGVNNGPPMLRTRGLNFAACDADELSIPVSTINGSGSYYQVGNMGAFLGGGVYDWGHAGNRDGARFLNVNTGNITNLCLKFENLQ